MPIYEYHCAECGLATETLHNPGQGGGGQLRISYGPAGKRIDGELGAPRPEIISCPRCGEKATYRISRCRAYLSVDATQSSGWARPGMTDVSYTNGPGGHPATQAPAGCREQNPLPCVCAVHPLRPPCRCYLCRVERRAFC